MDFGKGIFIKNVGEAQLYYNWLHLYFISSMCNETNSAQLHMHQTMLKFHCLNVTDRCWHLLMLYIAIEYFLC